MDRSITIEKLLEVWDAYVEFRRVYVAESTVIRDYGKIRRRIELMQTDSSTLNDGQEIRNWLLDRYSPETARRTIEQFNAATTWGEFNRLLPINPFLGLTRYLRPRRVAVEESYVAFSAQEKEVILNAFEEYNPFYLPWVKFLFYTGCRPEEAAALQWRHVANDFSEILIKDAYPADVRIMKETKSYKITRFPCNDRLRRLLKSLKPYPKCDKTRWVFLGPRGAPLNYNNFLTRHWKPMVERLADDGYLAFYLPQYHCRHTFITEAMKVFDPKTVAYLCRVSEAVLMKYYMSRDRDIEIPEF